MNPERLKKLQAQVAQVRIGGKGELISILAASLELFILLLFLVEFFYG